MTTKVVREVDTRVDLVVVDTTKDHVGMIDHDHQRVMVQNRMTH